MAPETWLGQHISEQSDLFALAMLLLEIHTRTESWAVRALKYCIAALTPDTS